MSSILVPQVEYVGGNTPQESAALFNARMIELRFNKPSFERDGMGFWITYSLDVQHGTPKTVSYTTSCTDGFPRCSECSNFERVSERVKWGTCSVHRASVDANKRICEEFQRNLGGDELNA